MMVTVSKDARTKKQLLIEIDELRQLLKNANSIISSTRKGATASKGRSRKLENINAKLADEAAKLQEAHVSYQEMNAKLEGEAKEHETAQGKLRDQKTKLESEAAQLLTDSLTGAYTRRRLLALGAHEISRARRYKSHFSMLMLDIDFFKTINDTYGHAAGDKVLISTTQTIAKHIRDTDILGRLGGDEFIVVFPNIMIEQAYSSAEKLRKTIEQSEIEWETEKIFVQVSIGVVEWSEQDVKFADLMKRADNSLYLAKRTGRNKVASDSFKND
ncbi:MAG: diguanylate cyclase with sensor [Firmicutes bacterium]|nr:diguanylate cyclase with sensor [Bacillota bacterium]